MNLHDVVGRDGCLRQQRKSRLPIIGILPEVVDCCKVDDPTDRSIDKEAVSFVDRCLVRRNIAGQTLSSDLYQARLEPHAHHHDGPSLDVNDLGRRASGQLVVSRALHVGRWHAWNVIPAGRVLGQIGQIK